MHNLRPRVALIFGRDAFVWNYLRNGLGNLESRLLSFSIGGGIFVFIFGNGGVDYCRKLIQYLVMQYGYGWMTVMCHLSVLPIFVHPCVRVYL